MHSYDDEYCEIDTKELASLFTNVTHLEDVSRLLSNYWTTSLESFHNVVINFAAQCGLAKWLNAVVDEITKQISLSAS